MMNVLQTKRAVLLLFLLLSARCIFSQSNYVDWSISGVNNGQLIMTDNETRTISYSVTAQRFLNAEGGPNDWKPVNFNFELVRQAPEGLVAISNIETITSADFQSNNSMVTKTYTLSVTARKDQSNTVKDLRPGDKIIFVQVVNPAWSPDKEYTVVVNYQPIGKNTISANGGPTDFLNSGDPNLIVGSSPSGGAGSPYTYKWQKSTTSASSGFSDISNTNVISYDPPTITQTTWYKRVVTSGGQTSTSNVLQFTVSTEPLGNNTITNTGSATFTDAGDPALLSGSIPTGGIGNYAYQWQSANLADPSNFVDIAGATEQSYDPPSTEITRYFKRKVTSGTETIYSNIISITISRTGATMNNPINIGDIGLCSVYNKTFTNFPEYGFGNDIGNATDDVFHKFNLTAQAKVSIGNCKSDGVSGSIYLLDASGNGVTGATIDYCDVGYDLSYTLQPGVYYIVSEGNGTQNETNYLPIYLQVRPLFTVSGDVTITAGTSTTLQATGSGLTYLWSPSTGLNTNTGASVIATPTVTTTYGVSGIAPGGCSDTKQITVTVKGAAGSTFENPIVANINGCAYYSPAIDPVDYGNDYGGPFNDVFYKFTIASATQVTIGPYWANDSQTFTLLNSTGGVITVFQYIYPSPDRVAMRSTVQLSDPISFTTTLQPGTYYVVVEGRYSNSVLGIFVTLPGCRMAAEEGGTLNPPIAKETTTTDETSEISMYPNPAKNDVKLLLQQDGPARVQFINSSGITVKQILTDGQSTNINTTDLPSGMYLLKITQGNSVSSGKLLIEEK